MSEEKARFGPAGKAESFAAMGYKRQTDLAEYLEKFSLDAFEYQCGRGLRVNEETVAQLGVLCREKGIALSLHAPYYISLSSLEEEKRQNSIGYIVESAKIAKLLGADRVVIHSGSCSKLSREEALELAKGTLGEALKAVDEAGLSDIRLCPETMGKVNQLGTLEEVLALCALDERLIPCIDFGHLNARTFGQSNGREAYTAILDAIADKLGTERGKYFHAHFSKIQYTDKGGEKCHLTFSDTKYGPEYEPLMALLAERGLCPRIICESAGTQSEDAQTMKRCYEAEKQRKTL